MGFEMRLNTVLLRLILHGIFVYRWSYKWLFQSLWMHLP